MWLVIADLLWHANQTFVSWSQLSMKQHNTTRNSNMRQQHSGSRISSKSHCNRIKWKSSDPHALFYITTLHHFKTRPSKPHSFTHQSNTTAHTYRYLTHTHTKHTLYVCIYRVWVITHRTAHVLWYSHPKKIKPRALHVCIIQTVVDSCSV